MRKHLYAIVFVLSAATLAAGFQQPQPWVKLSPPGGAFSVMMPTKPEESVETKDSPLGKYTTHLFITRAEGVIYIAGWVDYAPGVKLDVRGEINANRDNFLKGVEAKATSEKEIRIDGHPGIEFTGESAKALFKARVYLVRNRPYMVAAAWGVGQAEPPAVGTFLTSFALAKAARPGAD
ncbi:MAG TPA: hypothetical protein VF240_00030 [Pyrinomonadaceae bacterium]